MHYVGRFREDDLSPPSGRLEGRVAGQRRKMLIDKDTGSVHMYLMVIQLEPGGVVKRHLHNFEEGYFFLQGEVIGEIGDQEHTFVPGDYCIVPVDTPHSWRVEGSVPGRWVEMYAPQPSEKGGTIWLV
ncbi:MAG: cupin domain-containing protein [Dehalococcoidia bacterium]